MNKVIHYCWFGRNPLPESALKCIESWKKFCPDYEIIEWNEDNFDVNSCAYSKEAYENKKYAFTSDYARYKILYENGGIYVDTDVEMIKSIDDIINMPCLGFETKDYVAPGLIMIAYKKMNFYKKMIDIYESFDFFNIKETIVDLTTNELCKNGLIRDNSMQTVCGIKIFPMDYFNPKGVDFGKTEITKNTYTIHHYDASWKNETDKLLMKFRSKYGRKKGTIIFIMCHPFLSIKKYVKKKCKS